ncbi:MAG: PQQ-binding-like beta-propeller repeat protein [Verrucomicrobia bacterium]|nr:PQQ-binding-like beta-propeller repeat protein [Verrucomicrobiota bacterium]MDA1066180.1 PQQ-binding-like beta-propeller repeat protein [Verrucomicrobiota bacterium]
MKRYPCLLLLLASSLYANAANWGQWRGPNFNGSTDAGSLPTNWSKTENVTWSTDLPGPSAASPIVWDNHVFISTANPDTDTLHALCYDRNTGKLLWEHQIGKGHRRDEKSDFASNSPATDGEVVVFFYGTGSIFAYDFKGNELWNRNIEKDFGRLAYGWTPSTSPLLFDGKLILQILQRNVPTRGNGEPDRVNESYILALNPKTGEKLWRTLRPSQAVAESLEAFTSPVPYEFNGRKEILVAGGDDISGHDPANGKELWRWGTWNPTRIGHWRLVPSPVAGDGVILACAPKRDPIYAVKAGGRGTLNDDDLAWVSNEERDISSDVPTPAYYDGDFFVLSDVRNALSRVEPQSGKVKWSIATPGRIKFEASPLAADGKLYLMNFNSDVVVVDAESGKVLNEIAMGDEDEHYSRSSIAASDGQLFIRTNQTLYCIGDRS